MHHLLSGSVFLSWVFFIPLSHTSIRISLLLSIYGLWYLQVDIRRLLMLVLRLFWVLCKWRMTWRTSTIQEDWCVRCEIELIRASAWINKWWHILLLLNKFSVRRNKASNPSPSFFWGRQLVLISLWLIHVLLFWILKWWLLKLCAACGSWNWQ